MFGPVRESNSGREFRSYLASTCHNGSANRVRLTSTNNISGSDQMMSSMYGFRRRSLLRSSLAIMALGAPPIIRARGETAVRIGMVDR